MEDHYYALDFTLDQIRPGYTFDPSCQGSVPQALTAFFESVSFEDAIRNVVSIGGDSDTLGAITGSVAWVYYAVQTGGWSGWVYDRIDPAMLELKAQAKTYLPEEFTALAEEFHALCCRREEAYACEGRCAPILSAAEEAAFQEAAPARVPTLDPETEQQLEAFCRRYVVLLKVLYEDRELNDWCRRYSPSSPNTEHAALEHTIYREMLAEAYRLGFPAKVAGLCRDRAYHFEIAMNGTRLDQAYGICCEFRGDYNTNGSLIYSSIAKGRLYALVAAFLGEDHRERPPDEKG